MSKRIISAVLCLIFAFSVVSCSKPEPADEGEVREAAVSLLEAAVEVNRVFFGEGLPMGERVEPGYDIGYGEYVVLDDDYKYMTREDIMNLARAVYTKSYCDSIETVTFDGTAVDEDNFVAARYEEKNGEMRICYLLSLEGLPERLPQTDTLKTVEIGHDYAVLSVDTTCEGKTENVTFTLRLESSGWRLDTPTY